MRQTLLFALFMGFSGFISAAPGDTLVVQTYTFEEQNNPDQAYDSPGRRWFQFPSADQSYQKILMYYTLKCFEDGTAGNLGFPCGEWDYLTYNYLFDHTGVQDSSALTHPLYRLNNNDFETANVISTPLFNQRQYNTFWYNFIDPETGLTPLASEEIELGAGIENLSPELLESTAVHGRTQFIYTSEEIEAAFGANPFDLDQISFHHNSNSEFQLLDVRYKVGENLSAQDYFDEADMTEAYSFATSLVDDNWQPSGVFGDQTWMPGQDILIDMSYLSEAGSEQTLMDATNSGTSLVFAGDDRFIRFDNVDEVKVPASAFDNVDDQVTVSFWIRGDEVQPINSTIFEGVDASNNRQLNSHLPWGNGRVYWDAGFDGGYDRIDQQAGTADYEGKWNHWAFTKNVTEGTMKIYLNGELWHSGDGKDNPIGDIAKFSIGSAAGWSNFYSGDLDHFQVWSTELSQETIQEWMYFDPNETHPNYGALELFYNFNEENDMQVIDQSPNAVHAQTHGAPNRMRHHHKELFLNPRVLALRPKLKLSSFDAPIYAQEGIVTLDEPVPPMVLTTWEVQGNEVVLSAADYFWENGSSFVFDPDGEIIETIEVNEAEQTFTNETLSYFSAPFEVVDRYELGRFITPYGINLDLEEGWTWVFDVTDYAPLLRDSVELECGNWQELLDMKFMFIEGTPPRDVKRVERLWNGMHNLNTFDETVTEQLFQVQEGESTFRLKTRASGHGFGTGNNCAEFCNNIHSVEVNGSNQWSWQIMQECADNPLYPQGGTWIYDRAGWCPGDKVTTQNFELTTLVQGQDEFTVDYNIEYDPDGNYRFEGQIIAYGEPNFELDAEISDILSPSDWKVKSRMNPICNKPTILIRNNGSTPLTSLSIEYGIDGNMESYEWTGNLGFLETAEVQLATLNPSFWQGSDEDLLLFEVSISNPNGAADQNTSNDTATSRFHRPPTYTYGTGEDDNNEVVIWTKTNNSYWETEVRIENMSGDLVYLRNDFDLPNTNYRDTIQLNAGCYKFHLKDFDDDGLQFFANNDGSGSCRMKKVAGGNFINFENDFGKEIVHYFNFQTDLVGVEESILEEREINLFPNPSDGNLFMNIADYSGKVEYILNGINGNEIARKEVVLREGDLVKLDLENEASGIYFVQLLLENGERFTRRFIVQ